MPHFIVEYSSNIEEDLDIDDLLSKLHATALETGLFALGGIRVRAERRDHYIIADGKEDNAFLHLIARIRAGRTLEARKEAGEKIFATFCEALAPHYDTRPLALSFEIQEINPDLSFKQNNIHSYLKRN